MASTYRILCYGDSNTWGYIPNTNHNRYPADNRFPNILEKMLGKKYEIISEGLNSRTLVSDDPRPNKEGRNGSTYLIPCLDSHDPLNLVILMLGTNELKTEFNNQAENIGILLEKYFVKVILNRSSQSKRHYPQLIIVSPPIVIENEVSKEKFSGAHKKSVMLSKIFSNIAKKNDCFFIDGSGLEVGDDGVHLTKKGHKELAKKLSAQITKINFNKSK